MLKSARKAKKMSQKTLAERLGVTQPYISQLENKNKYNKNITVELIEKISKELDLDRMDVFLYFCSKSKA